MMTLIYSKIKPNVKADRYLCLSTDMGKIINTNENIDTDWLVNENDTNALIFMDNIFKYRIHPHSKWGIHVNKMSVETLKKLNYCYMFLEI